MCNDISVGFYALTFTRQEIKLSTTTDNFNKNNTESLSLELEALLTARSALVQSSCMISSYNLWS